MLLSKRPEAVLIHKQLIDSHFQTLTEHLHKTMGSRGGGAIERQSDGREVGQRGCGVIAQSGGSATGWELGRSGYT